MIEVTDGYTEHAEDWILADALRADGIPDVVERECEENADSNSAKLADLLAADAIAMYSFGAATGWDLTAGWTRVPAGKTFSLIVICAGVLDWAKGQFTGWTAPACAKRAYCFQPTHAMPASQPLRNVPWFDIDDPDLKEKLQYTPHANINCDALFGDPAWFDLPAKVAIHTTIMNHPRVIELAVWMFNTFV